MEDTLPRLRATDWRGKVARFIAIASFPKNDAGIHTMSSGFIWMFAAGHSTYIDSYLTNVAVAPRDFANSSQGGNFIFGTVTNRHSVLNPRATLAVTIRVSFSNSTSA